MQGEVPGQALLRASGIAAGAHISDKSCSEVTVPTPDRKHETRTCLFITLRPCIEAVSGTRSLCDTQASYLTSQHSILCEGNTFSNFSCLFTFFWTEVLFLRVCAVLFTTLPSFSWDTSVMLQHTKAPALKWRAPRTESAPHSSRYLHCTGLTLLRSERTATKPHYMMLRNMWNLSATLPFLKSAIWRNQRPWARREFQGAPPELGRTDSPHCFGCWVLCRGSFVSPRINQAEESWQPSQEELE